MSVKPCLSPFRLILIIILCRPTVTAIAKCNRVLMSEFGLTGMPYATYSPMHVCGYVHDKCCTISDEIAIHKYWNEYTKPLVDERIGEYMSFVNGITRMFYKLMALDPQLIVLKYVNKQKIPYNHEVCFSELQTESWYDAHEFHRYHDTKAKYAYESFFYNNVFNRGKRFNVRKYTHDMLGKRHWFIKQKIKHASILKKLIKKRHQIAKPRLPRPDFNKIICKKEENIYYKEIIIVNEEKADFCLGLYKKFLKLDNKILERFLPNVKNMLTQMIYLKSDIYCAICDAHQQPFFDIKKKVIKISNHFCRTALQNKRDLFNFMHIFFVEYMDEFLQYTQCFETNAETYSFPYANFLKKYKRRIPMIERCLDKSDKGDFMKYCWFLCNKYKPFGFDWFFDTDVHIVKRVYYAIFSFLHKMNTSADWHEQLKKNPNLVKGNVNGILIEPLNPSHAITDKYYVEHKTRKKLLGRLNTKIKVKRSKKKTKGIDMFLKKLGLPTFSAIIKLKKAHKKLKKKHKLLMRKHKFLLGRRSVKRFIKRLKAKRKKKKIKTWKKGYSKVNGLKDHLFKILRRFKVHHGFRPQRVLLDNNAIADEIRKALKDFGLTDHIIDHQFEISKIKARYLKDDKPKKQIKLMQKQKEKKASRNLKDTKKTKEKDPNRFRAKHIVVEPYSSIYEKSEPHFNIKKFSLAYDKDGINPIKHFALVHYRFNITTIIQRHFAREENVTNSVAHQYFLTRAKFINRFNFDMRTVVDDYHTVTPSKYLLNKRVEAYAKRKKRTALLTFTQKNMRKVMHRHARAIKRRKMFKHMIKMRRRRNRLRAMAKHHRIVKIDHHIDREHFWSNFFGFAHLFTGIFGT